MLVASGALIFLTDALHRTAVEMRTATDGVRVAEQMRVEVVLLDHLGVHPHEQFDLARRRVDSVAISTSETQIRSLLIEAREQAVSPRERELVDTVERKVNTLLAEVHASATSDGQYASEIAHSALDSLEDLAELNVNDAEAAEERADHLDRMGRIAGAGAGSFMLATLIATFVWLRANLFRPVLLLDEAIDRFAEGDMQARAPELGARELQSTSHRFNTLADELVRQQESQQTFLAAVVHEIRNPLSAMQLAVAQMPASAGRIDEARTQRMLGVVGRQVKRLERIVGDLFDIARAHVGQLDLDFVDCDVRDVVRETGQIFEGMSERHEVRIVLPEEPLMVRCDAARLGQVLNNLVSNAIKYSPSGPVDVQARLEGGDAITIAVRDRGVGLTAEEQRRIFAPFERLGRAHTGVPGTGLGLFVVRRIVDAHGGSIHIVSEPGKGSTFSVTLPRIVG